MRSLKVSLAVVFIFIIFSTYAQSEKQWYLQDSATNSIDGISLNKAYQFLKGKKSSEALPTIDGENAMLVFLYA